MFVYQHILSTSTYSASLAKQLPAKLIVKFNIMNFVNEIDGVKKAIIENAQLMRSFENIGNDEFRDKLKKFNDEIETMRLELGETLIGLKTRQKRLDNMLDKAANECQTLEELEAKYEEFQQTEGKKRMSIKLCTEFKEFKQELMNNPSANANIDAEVIEQDDNAICSMYDPWTKNLMLNPVRNIKCGHNYDRDSVMAVIKDRLNIHCPIVGCASKVYVQPNHLVPNEPLQERIRVYKIQQDDDEDNN
ncbi:E3 SUMO-protein ligase NSE2-like isoform X2 [Drosophila sulfurigaster albostrigata]|uniref:E3 SUMO-protein ligase NSE2-like isoform X2 n=1 Tax=Drosophila sulfurigaster albostrigata TaxID=89887 RepID=UPI002D21DC9E|nr:E3 SUMO-protein ligase NSE2-like isoform X2 [Drosophila sulfurigaster albostrigata]